MPHILVEYSSNLENELSVGTLIDDLHGIVERSGLFEIAAIRTRAIPRSLYRIADGDPANIFLHITARIRKGRNIEDRTRLGNALLQTVVTAFGSLPSTPPVALTVEIREIDPQMLFRHITIK